jgi:hypothetical protein
MGESPWLIFCYCPLCERAVSGRSAQHTQRRKVMKIKFWERVASALWRLGSLSLYHWATGKAMNAQVEEDQRNYAYGYQCDDIYDPQICRQHGWLNCEICDV